MVCFSVIGYGYWGPNIVRNLLNQGSFVKYVVDIDELRCKAVMQTNPTVIATTDMELALNDKDVDAVVIVLPAKMHYSVAKKALIYGKHVLVEKPITSSVAESEDLIKLAIKNNLVLMVDHTYIYSSAIKKIKELIYAQKLKIKHIESIRYNLGVFRSDVDVIWDLAPHDLSIICYLSDDEPIDFNLYGFSHTNNGLYDVATLSLKYPDFTANIHNSWISCDKIRRLQIVTDRCIIELDDLEKEDKIKVYDSGYKNENGSIKTWSNGIVKIPVEECEPLGNMVKDFITCINTGKKPDSDMYLGRKVVKILENAHKGSI